MQTRALLLECARNIILDEGIERLSMDRIAKRAGLSKGAVMYHFETKRALEAALLQDYADHLERGLSEHEALFKGTPSETFVPGFIAWFQSFDADNRGWASVGTQLLTRQQSDPELLEPVRLWYKRLYQRVESVPAKIRPNVMLVVMALEGFFYTHKFGLDVMGQEAKNEAYQLMLETTKTSHVERKPEAQAAEEPLAENSVPLVETAGKSV